MKRILKAILLIILGMLIMGVTANRSVSDSATESKPAAIDNTQQPALSQDQPQSGEETVMDQNNKTPKARGAGAPDQQGQSSSKPARQSSSSKYAIDVNVSTQKVRIYENGQLLKEWLASTGSNNSTPLGDFVIENRGEWFFSEKYQQGGKWWVSFKDHGVYLFHSLPMDRNKNLLADEAAKLGTPVSHGCIRLQEANARWIYDHIPEGTSVHINK